MSGPVGGKMAAGIKDVGTRLHAARTLKRADRSSSVLTQSSLERLPPEILIRILSYLDASALFCISHINKLFNRLANDNALWSKIYKAEFGKMKSKQKPNASKNSDQDPGYWRRIFFKAMAARDMSKLKRRIQPIRSHRGRTAQTKELCRDKFFRNLNVTWELTAINKSGQENTWEPSRIEYFDSSVMLAWDGGGCLPNVVEMATFHLHCVKRIALQCPGVIRPGWRSLMSTINVQTERMELLGQDAFLELKLLESGFLIGVWKHDQSAAFVMSSLHFNTIESAEESSAGFYSWPKITPPFDDIDPEYGLHGYRLQVVLHSTVNKMMSESFSNLFCRRGDICDGQVQLTAISRTNLSQHVRLSEELALLWWSEALQGTVKNCCFMTLTLLDEHGLPFRCISYPVSLKPQAAPVCYDYEGEHYTILYQDSDLQVRMILVWTEAEQQFVVISLVVHLSVRSINKHFDRDY